MPSGLNVEPRHVIADLTAPAVSPQTDQTLHPAETEPAGASLWDESTHRWFEPKRARLNGERFSPPPTSWLATQSARTWDSPLGRPPVTVHGDDTRYLGGTLLRARRTAVDGMTRRAVARGAHAVIGVSITYTPFAETLLVTAVTLTLPADPRYNR